MISTCGVSPVRSRTARAGGHDRLDLHVVDLRGDDPEPRAARAEHRVGLLERAHAVERALQPAHVARALVPRPLELDGEVLAVGEELVQRRVEQPDRHRQAGHRLEQPLEVLGLQRQQLGERGAAVLARLAHDHRLHLRLAVGGHEHVLGPAQADALGAELARARARPRACRRSRARRAGGSRRPSSSTVLEVRVDLGLGERHVVGGDLAGRAVDGDQVALVQLGVADAQRAAPRGRSAAPARRPRTACPSRARRARRARPCRPRR